MSEFFELFVFLNVNEELSQSVKNKLSFIDENIDFILQELFTIFLQLFWHGSTEHHALFIMRSLDKDLLNISSHAWVS